MKYIQILKDLFINGMNISNREGKSVILAQTSTFSLKGEDNEIIEFILPF